jgi:hypothetical protein
MFSTFDARFLTVATGAQREAHQALAVVGRGTGREDQRRP